MLEQDRLNIFTEDNPLLVSFSKEMNALYLKHQGQVLRKVSSDIIIVIIFGCGSECNRSDCIFYHNELEMFSGD
jgi:hypothetical protein